MTVPSPAIKTSSHKLEKIKRRLILAPEVAISPAQPSLFFALASSEEVKGINEKCFEKKKETSTCPASYDEDLQKRLWIKTESLLGISFLKEEKKADKIF